MVSMRVQFWRRRLSMNLKELDLILKNLHVSGSWCQCASKFWRSGLPMNRPYGVPASAGQPRGEPLNWQLRRGTGGAGFDGIANWVLLIANCSFGKRGEAARNSQSTISNYRLSISHRAHIRPRGHGCPRSLSARFMGPMRAKKGWNLPMNRKRGISIGCWVLGVGCSMFIPDLDRRDLAID